MPLIIKTLMNANRTMVGVNKCVLTLRERVNVRAIKAIVWTAITWDVLVSKCTPILHRFWYKLFDYNDTSDINECQSANGGCGHICMNSEGSFACSCRQGYTLSSDGFSCTGIALAKHPSCAVYQYLCFFVDIDECQSNNGGCEHACFNTAGSFTCDCRLGYALATDGSGCVGKLLNNNKLCVIDPTYLQS